MAEQSLTSGQVAAAQLGRFLARKGDGEPGTETPRRGLQRVDDIAEAFRLFRAIYKLQS